MPTYKPLFGAVALSALAAVSPALLAQAPQPIQPVQPVQMSQFAQTARFNVGDSVDFLSAGQWQSCTVASPLSAGSYGLQCGPKASKADATELRRHIGSASALSTYSNEDEAESRMPQGETIGARYGTREPRKCDHSKPAMSADAAKDLFICDAEHEFAGSLYLVSDVNLDIATPRAFNPGIDNVKKGIDPAASVLDIHASYHNFQCRPVPANSDNPNVRNCDEFTMNNSSGGCFKNKTGEWHCMMYDFHPGSTATATNVRPPTLVE